MNLSKELKLKNPLGMNGLIDNQPWLHYVVSVMWRVHCFQGRRTTTKTMKKNKTKRITNKITKQNVTTFIDKTNKQNKKNRICMSLFLGTVLATASNQSKHSRFLFILQTDPE